MKYSIGDRVIVDVVKNVSTRYPSGEIGTIIYIDGFLRNEDLDEDEDPVPEDYYYSYLIRFDKWDKGHNVAGIDTETNDPNEQKNRWWISEDFFQLYKPITIETDE